jgi:ABC-type multidrug transport system ATPase subunit
MTGRENLYLNCTLMGLDIHTTRERIEKIIEFAGVAEYADVAIKRYSSGMLARLGFAAAVHMDPEIILMDEVMAVGDYSFNVRSTAAIQEYVRRGTVVLVSHDMAAIERICQRVIWLDKGNVVEDGPAPQVVQAYTQFQQQKVFAAAVPVAAEEPVADSEIVVRREQFDAHVAVHSVEVLDADGKASRAFGIPARITVRVEADVAEPRADLRFLVGITDSRTRVTLTSVDNQQLHTPDFVQGRVVLEAHFPALSLRPREYGVSVRVMNAAALKPMYTWDDVSPRFVVAGERRNPRLHYYAPQDDLLFAPGAEMRYTQIQPAAPNVPATTQPAKGSAAAPTKPR